MPVNTGYLGSNLTTDFPSNVSVRSPVRLFSTLSVGGASTLQGVVTLSGALNSSSAISASSVAGTTFSANTIDFFSVSTGANTSGMTTRELRLVQAASGFSLMYSSGATVYTIGASAVSAAQD